MSRTSQAIGLWYPYEEFADHMRAMKTVRAWEYTARFGHVGNVQSSRANIARVIEYFSDSYASEPEAVYKARIFLSVHDYIGRHTDEFTREAMLEDHGGGALTVDPNLLRAVHHVFTASADPTNVDPRQVLALAKAFQRIDQVA